MQGRHSTSCATTPAAEWNLYAPDHLYCHSTFKPLVQKLSSPVIPLPSHSRCVILQTETDFQSGISMPQTLHTTCTFALLKAIVPKFSCSDIPVPSHPRCFIQKEEWTARDSLCPRLTKPSIPFKSIVVKLPNLSWCPSPLIPVSHP